MTYQPQGPEFRRRLSNLSEAHLAEVAAERELGELYASSYGRPAGKVTARYVDDHALICFLEDLDLMPSEQFLIDNGKSADLIKTRELFQQALRPFFRAAVERATGRRVKTFSGVASVDPPMNIEIFIFDGTS
jgi:uncharacterized protein YbcI